MSTATHGSGTRYTSLSGVVRGVRLVTGSGEIREISEDEPDMLRAAQVAVGMLGVMTRLELEVTDAYRLREQVGLRSWDDVMEHWDELVSEHRHFGFFWLPTEESAALYNLHGEPGTTLTDQCYVKLFDEVGPDVPDDDTPDRRVDRCYRIFPMVYDPNFHELEYFVALEKGPDALRAMRELMLKSLPDSVYPLEVRTVGRRRRVPLAPVRDARRPSSRSRASRAPTTGTTCGPSTRCSPTSTRACTGASCTSSPPSGSTPCTRGRTTSSPSAASSTRPASSSTTTCGPCSGDARGRLPRRPPDVAAAPPECG